MSLWNKNPDKFPPSFHRALEAPLADPKAVFVLGYYKSEDEAKRQRQHFYAFRCSLRKHPAHRLFEVEKRFSIKTRVVDVTKEVLSVTWKLEVYFYDDTEFEEALMKALGNPGELRNH